MRMRPCPACGAENSVKRTKCYRCEQALMVPADQTPRQEAASRWEALEPIGGGTRNRAPRATREASSPTATGSPAARRPAARSYMPMVRSALGHVRRMGVFFRELHTLVQAGISLAAACHEVSRRAPRNLRELAQEMALAAEGGQPLFSVMEQHRDLFYPWHIGVVRAAQAGGFLPEAFEQIAHAYEVEWETRSALRLRLFFYVFLGLPGILLAIPSILMLAEPIPDKGWTPELAAKSVMGYFLGVSVPIALGLAALVIIWQVLTATAWFQGVQQRAVLRLPVVGRVAKAAALERYLAVLGLLLRGSVPAASAAEEAAQAAGNVVLMPKLQGIVPALREGTPLAQAMAAARLFDRDTTHMAATGEVSGSLPEMLGRAAGYYRQENEARRRMLLRIAQVAFGVIWLSAAGAVLIIAMRTYFGFAFRTYDWILRGIE